MLARLLCLFISTRMNKSQRVKILVILQLPTEHLQKIKQYFESSGFDADVYKTEISWELILNCIELYEAVIIDEGYAFSADILKQAKKLKVCHQFECS